MNGLEQWIGSEKPLTQGKAIQSLGRRTLARAEQSATRSATTLPGSKQNDEKTAVVTGAEAEAHSAIDTGEGIAMQTPGDICGPHSTSVPQKTGRMSQPTNSV